MDKNLKLYVWRDIMCDNTCGMAFAIAHNLKEAKAKVIESDPQYSDWARREMNDDEPQVLDIAPVGFYVIGGG